MIDGLAYRRVRKASVTGALFAAALLLAGSFAARPACAQTPPAEPPASVTGPAPAEPPPAPKASTTQKAAPPQASPSLAKPGGTSPATRATTPKSGAKPGAAPTASAPAAGAPDSGDRGAAPGQSIFGLPTSKDGVPVAVEADNGIEWQQEKQLYIARGNAKAVRGDVTVYGDTLMAYYRKTDAGGSDIWRLEGDENVKIISPNATVVGEKAVYDVDNAIFVLTGKGLELTSPKAVITARDSMEYWQQRQYAVARGDAKAVREDKTVRADILTAHFAPDQKGDLQISHIEAFRNVTINTANAVARGVYGDYNLESGIAILKGSVKITRGDDQLDGECAEVNMNTGISRLFSCTKQDRVRGLLVPKQGEDAAGAGKGAPGKAGGKPKQN